MNKDSRSLLHTTNDIIDNDTREIGIKAGPSSDSDGESIEVVDETTGVEILQFLRN